LRSRALPDHSIERVGKEAARAADVSEVSRLFEVALDDSQMAPIVQLKPDCDGLGENNGSSASSSDNASRLSFRATLGLEPEVEVALV
jgi:hypothetical protein